METLDDFEMKPITKGLGFHKKTPKEKKAKKPELAETAMPKSVPAMPAKAMFDDNTIQQPLTYEDLLKSLSSEKPKDKPQINPELRQFDLDKPNKDFKVTATLPRKEERKAADAQQQNSNMGIPAPMPFEDIVRERELPVDDIDDIPIPGGPRLRQTPVTKKQEIKVDTGVRRSSSNSPAPRLSKSPICVRSIFLDGLMVVAIALIFLTSLLAVTGVSLESVFGGFKENITTQVPIAILYLAIYQIYVIGTRSFFGRTLGEWTFDHQLGRDEEQEQGVYPLKVVWRSLLIVLTGVVVLPLLSFISRVDVASYLSGLQLYRIRD